MNNTPMKRADFEKFECGLDHLPGQACLHGTQGLWVSCARHANAARLRVQYIQGVLHIYCEPLLYSDPKHELFQVEVAA